jgi:hypothetical protein
MDYELSMSNLRIKNGSKKGLCRKNWEHTARMTRAVKIEAKRLIDLAIIY